jgi:Flp pilus assembly pilin Flp
VIKVGSGFERPLGEQAEATAIEHGLIVVRVSIR